MFRTVVASALQVEKVRRGLAPPESKDAFQEEKPLICGLCLCLKRNVELRMFDPNL